MAWPDHVGFFLAPLAILLVVSRPKTLRERIWVVLLALWAAAWLLQRTGMAQTAVRATAVVAGGTFVATMLWRPRAPFRAMVLASATGLGAVAVWGIQLGLGWREFQREVTRYGLEAFRQLSGAGAAPVGLRPEAVRATLGTVARFYPGITVCAALAGMALAWGIYHRVASTPMGSHPGPFKAFRFMDQVIWAVIAALAVVISPLPGPWHTLAGNLMLVLGGLYLVRGAAVVAAVVPPPGWVLGLMIAVVSILLAPLAGTSLVVVGIADTWIDFRRRLPPAAQGAKT